MLGTLRGQKRASDTLELELYMVVSCLVGGAGNGAGVFYKSSKYSELLSQFSSSPPTPPLLLPTALQSGMTLSLGQERSDSVSIWDNLLM